ncbi:GTP-binding protein ryh1 [Nematostella vectensis]|uniref:GTP-binding protein ryh1 n=1 Tax=Nematostella vectensis TaxID=45351 RepID=UPI00138FEA79|nr:GTP-binding protein ryh1 [Nematostella vectensis]
MSSPPKHKIVFLGDQGVGKSSLAGRFIYDIFEEKYQPTIGIDFMTKTVLLDDFEVRLQIWDTAGQERFRCLIHSYIRDSEAALIVFDITNYTSFESVGDWVKMVRDERGEKAVIIIVGNKMDESDRRKVSYDVAEKSAERLGLSYVETSAKSGYNVKLLFTKLSKDLYLYHFTRYLKMKEERRHEGEQIIFYRKDLGKRTPERARCTC